jgi:hypothetical protein
LTLDSEGIERLLNQYEKEARAIKEESLRLVWFMRGGLSYNDSMLLSEQEREIIGKIIEDNMETTKKSGLPFF